jgi:hypothetical protein
LLRIAYHEPSQFHKIQPVFTNPTNPHESLVHRRSIEQVGIHTNPVFWISKSVSCSKG